MQITLTFDDMEEARMAIDAPQLRDQLMQFDSWLKHAADNEHPIDTVAIFEFWRNNVEVW